MTYRVHVVAACGKAFVKDLCRHLPPLTRRNPSIHFWRNSGTFDSLSLRRLRKEKNPAISAARTAPNAMNVVAGMVAVVVIVFVG